MEALSVYDLENTTPSGSGRVPPCILVLRMLSL